MKKLIPLLLSLVLYLSAVSKIQAATLYWVGADGANASVASNWSTTNPTSCIAGVTPSGAAPTSADTINFDADCDNGATIDSGFTSTVLAVVLNTGYAGTVTLSNPLTVSTTSTFFGGTFSCSSSQSLTTTGAVTVSGGTLNLISCTTTDMNSSLTITSGTFNAPSGAMTLAGALTISGSPTFNANGGTITFDGTTSAVLSCNNVVFSSITFAHTSSTKTVNSNCTLPLGNNPILSTGAITVVGALTGTGTLTKSGSALTFNTGGTLSGFSSISVLGLALFGATLDLSNYSSVTVSGTLTVTSGLLTLSNTENVISSTAVSGGTVLQSSGTFTSSVTVSVSGAGVLTLANGADLNGSLVISGGTFNAPSGIMTLAGALTISGTPTFNANSGTITFDGGSTTISCTKSDLSVISFNTVAINNTGTKVISSGCVLPLGANPTIPTSVSLSGTLSGTGTLTMSAGALSLNTGAALTGFSGLALPQLTVAGATANLSSLTSFSTRSTLTLSSGSITLPNGADLNGALTISGGTFNAPSGTMTLVGALTISGSPTFNANGGTITFDGGSATLSCNNVIFNHVIFNNTGIKTVSSNCTLPIGSNPTLLGTGSITLNGTFSGTGLLTTNGLLTVGSTGLLSTFTGFSGGSLTISGGSKDFSAYSPMTISGNLNLSGSTFVAPDLITLAGNFTCSSCTYTHNNGTLVLNGLNQILGGNVRVTFNNVTKESSVADTLYMSGGLTNTFDGTLRLTGGGPDALLSLRSSVGGSTWRSIANGPRILQYLDVKDAENRHGTMMLALDSVDSGNNTGWLFSNGQGVHSLVSPSDRNYTRDERPTFSWRPPSERSFFEAAREYSLIVDNGSGSDFVVEGIPAGRLNGSNIYETEKYRVEYLNWDNEDLGDNLISLKTKSSTNWLTDFNDGKLSEGKRNWRVQFKDSSNTIYEMSNELYVDFTPPTTSFSKINSLDYVPAVLTSDTTPTIFGRVLDELKGNSSDRKVTAGPRSIDISIEQSTKGGYKTELTDTIILTKSYWQADGSEIVDNTKNTSDKFSPFEYTFTKPLPAGTYKITLTPRDNTDNAFASQIFQIRISAYSDVLGAMTEELQQTYQTQIAEKSALTIPDPNEDQEKLVEKFQDEVEQKSKESNQSIKKTNQNWFYGGLIFFSFVLGIWFLLFWMRKRRKKDKAKT